MFCDLIYVQEFQVDPIFFGCSFPYIVSTGPGFSIGPLCMLIQVHQIQVHIYTRQKQEIRICRQCTFILSFHPFPHPSPKGISSCSCTVIFSSRLVEFAGSLLYKTCTHSHSPATCKYCMGTSLLPRLKLVNVASLDLGLLGSYLPTIYLPDLKSYKNLSNQGQVKHPEFPNCSYSIRTCMACCQFLTEHKYHRSVKMRLLL